MLQEVYIICLSVNFRDNPPPTSLSNTLISVFVILQPTFCTAIIILAINIILSLLLSHQESADQT
mgnify:CR=1 FL=1